VLVLAHGFTQTRRAWGSLAADLATDHRLVLVDLPGHGGSAGTAADLVAGADLLAAVGGPAAYLGYSMGGRFCLHLALARPDLVDRLVLVSTTPGIADATERAARRAADDALADELDPPGADPGRDAERRDAFLHRWLAQPLFASLPPEVDALDERRRNTACGLASSLRLAGTGTQQPLWSELGRLAMPVLVVTGADDAKYDALAEQMVAAIGANASHVRVPGAGHAVHLERPAEVAAAVRAFGA
jgi:2-succinyl-6-hydroxy-2,4-cyclohexadiene-1-carboxylate synthase